MQAQPNTQVYPQLPAQQSYGSYSQWQTPPPSQLFSSTSQIIPYGGSNNPASNNYGGPSFQSQAVVSQNQPSGYAYNQPLAQSQLTPYPQPTAQQFQSQQSQQPSNSLTAAQPWANRPAYGYTPAPQTQLRPQQLETVSRDEDPVYGPLGRARAKIDRSLTADNEISLDVGDLLTVPTNEQYATLQPNGPSQPLRITRSLPLPDALHQELNYKHLTAKMGLFEDIERAWFTVDNKLFLWDYNDGRDFSRYDEQNDTIQAVGLVKARKDVFVDDITHVLVICTATKISLLGLSRNGRELSLYQTNLSVETSTPMVEIKGTATGRIFMNGLNKELYELDYSSNSGWFGSGTKVQLHNRSSGSLSDWIPTIFTSTNREGIESFVVDTQRQYLYTLHTKGEIEMFDVSGTGFNSRGRYTRIKSDLANRGNANVASIAVVGAHESRRVGLVIISGNGHRIYMSVSPFSPLAIRPAPSDKLSLSSQTFYSSGTVIAVQHDTSQPSPRSVLTYIVPNCGRQPSMRENFENFDQPILQEWTASETIPSQVWTIVELPSGNPAYSPPTLTNSGLALNPLSRQISYKSREFLILAASGLSWAVQPRPTDLLEADLDSEKEIAINFVRNVFGRVQLAAMGIVIGSNSDLSKLPDAASVVNAIILGSGVPQVRDSTAGRSIVYSARHDGFALTLARLLRPIWNSKVTMPVVGGRQVLGVPEGQLLAVQGRLESLKKYIDEHPFPRHQADGDVKLAWDQEELSLHGLQVLLKQAIEAISFILLLSDYKISEIVARCDPGLQQTLGGLTYVGLLTSGEGRDVAKKLVTALIEQQIGQELGIDTLSEILQQRCGSFCQPGDVVMYKAEENMRRAEGSRNPQERSESLGESLRLFSKAAGSMPLVRLQEVSKRYRNLQYTVGAIELPLKCAADLDPSSKAEDYVRDGRHPGDPRKALHDSRMECYSCVIEALAMFDQLLDKATAEDGSSASAIQKHDEAYSLAIASDDELFHFYLYDWHVSRGLSDQLLEYDTPFIERYLQLTSSNLPERRDLLWKFYARREEFLPAAKALEDLATRPSDLPLHDRIYYLAQALTNAKSAASIGTDDVEFTSSLQERIDVGQVQMEIARSIESHAEMTDADKDEQLRALRADLLGLDELYINYARPLRLYEPILLILKTADTRIEDVCEAVWRQLLHTPPSDERELPPSVTMSEIVVDLCRKYFPSEAAPTDLVIPVIFSEAASLKSSSSSGWATQALLDGGIPIRDIWDVIIALHDQDDSERDFYAEEAAVLIGQWLEDRHTLPAADVEQFASSYLLRTGGQNLDERKLKTREVMTAAKRVAGRY